MAITTIDEATAVNTLLGYLMPSLAKKHGSGDQVDEASARNAALLLSRSAHRMIGAGIHASEIQSHWHLSIRRRPGGRP